MATLAEMTAVGTHGWWGAHSPTYSEEMDTELADDQHQLRDVAEGD